MQNEVGHRMDDDPVVDNGLSNDIQEANKQFELNIPKNSQAFNKDDPDEPQSNRLPSNIRNMSDDDEADSDDNRLPYRKELKLEKIKQLDDSDTKMKEEAAQSSDDAASVKRSTTLNPTTLTSNFLTLADENKKAKRAINI